MPKLSNRKELEMREQKYKVWNGHSMSDHVRTIQEIMLWNGSEHTEAVSKLVFLEFTGLKDKNGKDIHEGDILKAKKNCMIDDGFKIHLVDFIDGGFCADGCALSIITGSFAPEIIGNIHESPELMENITNAET